ncbi:hypothetical protein BDR04DRAFT_997444, partial [Suillus decipiens]
KIGILCLQEMHFMMEHLTQIETLFSRRLTIFNTNDLSYPGNLAGVAFVLNKEIVNTKEAKMTTLIPG